MTVYELPDPDPVLTGPGAARITVAGHDRIAGEVDAAGTYRLAVQMDADVARQSRIGLRREGAGRDDERRRRGAGRVRARRLVPPEDARLP